MNSALFAAELIENFTTHSDPDDELFEDVITLLQNLNEEAAADRNKKNILINLIIFQLNLLIKIGLKPLITGCANCKNDYL